MAKFNPLLLIPPVLLAGFVVFVAIGNFREDRNDLPSARAGHPAPTVAVEQLADKTLFTDAMLRSGEVTLVNFWASWCPPCRVEHPLVEELAAEGIPVYGVNYRDQPDRALAFLEDLGDPYAAIGADPNARMGLDWGVVGLPETFVIDGEGNVIMRHAGPLTQAIIENRLRPAMARAAGGS